MKLLAALLGVFLLVGPAYGLGSEPTGNTGDRKLDSTLGKINTAARADPDGFIRQLSSRYGIPEQEVRRAQKTSGLGASDMFMATALAKATGRPVLSVAEDYNRNQGKGWGVMAKGMGIKPGSSEFHALKNGAQGSLGDMESANRSKQKHEQEVQKQHQQQQKHEQEMQKQKQHEQNMKKDAQDKGQGKSK